VTSELLKFSEAVERRKAILDCAMMTAQLVGDDLDEFERASMHDRVLSVRGIWQIKLAEIFDAIGSIATDVKFNSIRESLESIDARLRLGTSTDQAAHLRELAAKAGDA
jgi:hypothetical protein